MSLKDTDLSLIRYPRLSSRFLISDLNPATLSAVFGSRVGSVYCVGATRSSSAVPVLTTPYSPGSSSLGIINFQTLCWKPRLQASQRMTFSQEGSCYSALILCISFTLVTCVLYIFTSRGQHTSWLLANV